MEKFINDGCLEYKAEYNPRKYSADTIENILSSISETAHQFAVCNNINVVAMLDKRHAAVLDEFNRTECDYDNTQTIPSLYRLGFTWPITGDGYIHNAIDAVRSLGFFD